MKFNVIPIVLIGIYLLFITSCQTDKSENEDQVLESLLLNNSNGNGKSYFILPNENDYSQIPQDPLNTITKEKVELGKMLFHETIIGIESKNKLGYQQYSCASCHHVKAGFQAGIPQGIGEGGVGFGESGESRVRNLAYSIADIDVQPLRSPSALNIAYQTNILWNGQFGATGVNKNTESAWTAGTPKEKNYLGYEGVETQAIAGQDVHRLGCDLSYFKQNNVYKNLFANAYPELEEDKRFTKINIGKAIAAYERTLLANQAPFQRYLKGETGALSTLEKQGAILFFGKAECVKCHTGPALNSMNFFALGMGDLHDGILGHVIKSNSTQTEHKGRGGFTGRLEDMYKFKVPQLYNLREAKFYGHGATFFNMENLIQYKNKAIPENSRVPASQISKDFHPLNLTNEEVKAITQFIMNGLNDPNLERFVPSTLPSGHCFPNSDNQSKIDMGCN